MVELPADIPPERTRKYPWALGRMKVGVPVFIKGVEEGQRAAKAARMWCYRNYPGGERHIVTRKTRLGVKIWLVWGKSRKARQKAEV